MASRSDLLVETGENLVVELAVSTKAPRLGTESDRAQSWEGISRSVEGLDPPVDTVFTPELAAFDAVLGVGVGDDLAAAGAADYLDPAHLMDGLVDLVLLDLWVAYVQDHVTGFAKVDGVEYTLVPLL